MLGKAVLLLAVPDLCKNARSRALLVVVQANHN